MKTQILEQIACVVSDVCEVPVERIRSHNKCEETVDARTIFAHYCRMYGLKSYSIMRYLHRTRTCVVDNYLANYYIYYKQSYMFRLSCKKVADKLAEMFPQTT